MWDLSGKQPGLTLSKFCSTERPYLPAQCHYPHNFWQVFWHWVFIGKSDCLEPSVPFLQENSMFPALPFPEETSPKSTLKTWTQIACTAYYFQAGLMILQLWLIPDKCWRLVMIVSCRQRGRTSLDLPQCSFHCCCRAKSWARFAGPWPWGLSQDLLKGTSVKCGCRSVHTADSLTSTFLLRVGEHLLIPELRPGVGRSLIGHHSGWLWRVCCSTQVAAAPWHWPPALGTATSSSIPLLWHNQSESSLDFTYSEASRSSVWRNREEERRIFKLGSCAEPVVCAGHGHA